MTEKQINEIFNDNYKPPWMIEQERTQQEQLDYDLTIKINQKWRYEALEAINRISNRHKNPNNSSTHAGRAHL